MGTITKALLCLIAGIIFLPGKAALAERMCRVVLEESDVFTAPAMSAQIPAGSDCAFGITPNEGWMLTGCDYDGATIIPTDNGDGVTLCLPHIRYSTVVSLQALMSSRSIIYEGNGGLTPDGRTQLKTLITPKHLRANTASSLFTRSGYTQIGWSTAPEETGALISPGSRVDIEENEQLTLYAVWKEWTDAACFDWKQSGSGAVITGYSGRDEVLTVPGELGGLPVMGIADKAFANAPCEMVILPESLRRIEPGAFSGCALQTLVMFDTLQNVHDAAFSDCENLRTLRIQASAAPVYGGTYYSTFTDKMDHLLSLRDQRKIVLFSGSSTRFGYDSAMIDEAFPDYNVANMGVFAYTNAVPQLLLILDCMQPGDILIDSPELDAAKRQFCTTNKLDAAFFRLIEGDYDLLARLDLRDFSGVFSAFTEYQTGRAGLPERSYLLSASDFDEDGAAVPKPSYNEYGDYILFRPDAEEDAPIYGLGVPYTKEFYAYEQYIAPYNAMIDRFRAKGVQFFFTWSPRNREAVSAESTQEAFGELEVYFNEAIDAPKLLTLSDSLVPGRLLFGTDNHLSTRGCALRTGQIIAALKEAIEP